MIKAFFAAIIGSNNRQHHRIRLEQRFLDRAPISYRQLESIQ